MENPSFVYYHLLLLTIISPFAVKIAVSEVLTLRDYKPIFNDHHQFTFLGKVQMNVTVPHRQKGSALSSLRFAQGQALSEAKDLSAQRDRPFASLRVTRWDSCTCEGLFFTTEPCLMMTNNGRHHVMEQETIQEDQAEQPEPILRVEKLTKSYAIPNGKLTVLRDVELQVQRGEFVAITGQSGSGKTTLLALLGALDIPDAGEIWLDDIAVHTLQGPAAADFRRQKIGFGLQLYYLLPN